SRDVRAKSTPAGPGPAAGEDGATGTGPAKVVDEKARARRIATRERRVEGGIEEFRIWLQDLARRGLAEVVSEGYKPFDAMAARLVDAQAATIARMVRGVGWRVAGGARGRATEDAANVDWADDLLDVMGRMFLLVETHGRRQNLSEAMQAEVRTL